MPPDEAINTFFNNETRTLGPSAGLSNNLTINGTYSFLDSDGVVKQNDFWGKIIKNRFISIYFCYISTLYRFL